VRNGAAVAEPEVLEKGPHFSDSKEILAQFGQKKTDDSYWNTTGQPRVETVDFERGNNNSGIDLASGTFADLGSPQLTTRIVWRFRR
jgi:hypothetical protein